MGRINVCIRIDEDDWEKFNDIAERIGFSRNFMIASFIKAVVSNSKQVNLSTNNVNFNVAIAMPINQTNVMIKNNAKALKNELILDELRVKIQRANEFVNCGQNIPYGIKEQIKKLINKASFIPPELFEEARKIIIT